MRTKCATATNGTASNGAAMAPDPYVKRLRWRRTLGGRCRICRGQILLPRDVDRYDFAATERRFHDVLWPPLEPGEERWERQLWWGAMRNSVWFQIVIGPEDKEDKI